MIYALSGNYIREWSVANRDRYLVYNLHRVIRMALSLIDTRSQHGLDHIIVTSLNRIHSLSSKLERPMTVQLQRSMDMLIDLINKRQAGHYLDHYTRGQAMDALYYLWISQTK